MSGKPGLDLSPLAVPFPAIPAVSGVDLAVGRAGLYAHERNDVMVMRFAPGTSCAGVFTRHRIGSAPVDWCQEVMARIQGSDLRALVVNAGCANSFTGKPGGRAAARVAKSIARQVGCQARQVMLASTGVIGVLLDDAKLTSQMPKISAGLDPDADDFEVCGAHEPMLPFACALTYA